VLVSGVDLDGYGPYKPVPPPKPLPPTGFQPPPYRMPPTHNTTEQHELPGAMMQPEQAHGLAALQTHSNKFPVSFTYKFSHYFNAKLLLL
jgi:hypothetical protein